MRCKVYGKILAYFLAQLSIVFIAQFLLCRKNASIKLQLDAFATECAWDHVYVYDGWSIYDPLVAAFR